MPAPRPAPIIRHLVLWLTTACNLSCAYCYRGDPDAISMPPATALAALELAAAGGGPFHAQLAGGEPTLEPELMALVARRVRQAGWPATLAVQTNAVALDREMALLCRRERIAVGVSLDGPPAVQERLRGRAAATGRGLEELERAGVDFSVTAVVSAANLAELPALALWLGGLRHCRGLGLDLLVRRGRAADTGPSPATPETLTPAMAELARTMAWINRRRQRPLALREARRLARGVGAFCPAAQGASLAVHPDGRLYPCGQTMGDPDLALGTIQRPTWERLAALGHWRLAANDCAGCELAGRCPGECPSRLKYNGAQGRALACALWRGLARGGGAPHSSVNQWEQTHATL